MIYLPPPEPLHLYAVAVQTRRRWSILSHTISRTKTEAHRTYCAVYVPEHRPKIAKEFREGRLRIVPVTVTAQMEATHD